MISKTVCIYSRGLVLLIALQIVPVAFAADTGKTQNEAVVGHDSTNIDFSAANIDGKMQAPNGFFLQGRQAQSLTQMVKLRSKFRSELRNSKSAVKDLVK